MCSMTPIQSAITEDGCWLITLSEGLDSHTSLMVSSRTPVLHLAVYLMPGPLYCPTVHPFPPVGNQK